MILFSIIKSKLDAFRHAASSIAKEVQKWDINDHFGNANLRVSNVKQDRNLANFLGNKNIALLRDRGCILLGTNLKETVRTTIYLLVNARNVKKAMQMDEPRFLNDWEIKIATS